MARPASMFKRVNARFIALLMIATMLLWIPLADTPFLPDGDTADVPFADGDSLAGHEPVSDPGQQAAADATAEFPGPVWPKAASGRVNASEVLTHVSGTPVSVRTSSPREVSVEVRGQDVAAALGIAGVVTDVTAATDSDVDVTIDYAKFQHAFGADWASRLKLWTTDGDQFAALDTRNDRADSTVTATVPVTDDGTRVVLMADTSGGAGDYSATALSPSATWSHTGNAGGFVWNYPIDVPNPVGAGPMPTLGFDYSSASVDGRSEATNNQPGWIGEGWALSIGSIERRFVSCANDMDGAANNTEKTGDKCWAGDNAMLTMAGRGGELVKDDDTGAWRLKSDDGTRIEKKTDTTNSDNSNEYWVVTVPDGTKYYFGLNRLPGWASGNAETKSVWTVPVAGNHPDEPCNASSFASSFCDQAWKWNLDYVEDADGNTMSFWYAPETNKYAKAGDASSVATYTRGGELTRIDYGTDNRDGTEYTGNAPGRVVFTSADRCTTESCATKDEANWPDTPWDSECTASTCAGKFSPSFWSTKRLSKVTTQVWDATAVKHQNIDSWSLDHSFPSPGDGTRAGLWLESITRTGHVGGDLAMPKVSFDWIQMHNRVEVYDGIPTMNWMRMGTIWTETGTRIGLAYSPRDCADGDVPSDPGNNDRMCYPVKAPKPFDPDTLETHWYHKYVLTTVTEYDQLTETTAKTTEYEYLGTPAWRYDEPDFLVEKRFRTWSDYRGYEGVRVRVGENDEQTLTETRYFRGMHGDKDPAGGTRSVTVPAAVGDPVTDHNQYSGLTRETTVYNGVDTEPVSRQVFVPWRSAPTAERTEDGHTTEARYVRGEQTRHDQTVLDGDRGWRTTRTDTAFDGYGAPTSVADHGDIDVTGDERCTLTDYARNTDVNLLTPMLRVRTYALVCGTSPTSDADIIVDTRYSYDGLAYGVTPTKGDLTKTETIDGFVDGEPTYVVESRTEYDPLGRVSATWDVRANKTGTTYTPATGVVTSVTTTHPLGWTSSETRDLRGAAITSTDVNGKITATVYDPLGRLIKVWLPTRSTGHSPSYEYSYQVSETGANAVVTRKLNAATVAITGYYTVSTTIFDGLLRTVQTQEVSPGSGGGRILTDTRYDSVGRESEKVGPYRSTGEPSAELFVPTSEITARSETHYDRANRATDVITFNQQTELWRTTTSYGGDYTTVTPPDGGVPRTTVTDARGQTVEQREHLDRNDYGVYQSTWYDYDRKGKLVTVTDHVGNAWTYDFDIRGNQTAEHDPDRGTTTSTYNAAGDRLSTTDARGITLSYVYDVLGRKTELYDGTVTGGVKLSAWRYDAPLGRVARGHLSGWSTFDDGAEYRMDVGQYDNLYNIVSGQHIIPETEGALAGTYKFSRSFAVEGSPESIMYHGFAGAYGENYLFEYDQRTGLPLRTRVASEGTYAAATDYTGLGEVQSVRYLHNMAYAMQSYQYDDATRRVTSTRILKENAPSLVSNTSYAYDPAGNITGISDSVTGDNQCFDYDALARLTSAWTPSDGDCSVSPATGGLGGPAAYWQSYAFDAIGNRTAMTNNVTGETTDYAMPVAGSAQPHTVSTATTDGQVTEFDWDPAGNMTSRQDTDGATQELTWTPQGKLDTVSVGDAVTSHVYSPDGERLIRRDADGGAVLYLPGQELKLSPTDAVSCTRYYTYLGKTIAVREGITLKWLLSDHQGTSTIYMEHSGQVDIGFRYSDPYGNPRGTAALTWPSDKGFVGGTNDPSGLTHIGAREYDPNLGRFISDDPVTDLTDPQQIHGYAYANNTPITKSDPSGMYVPSHDGPGHDRAYVDPNKGGYSHYTNKGQTYRNDGNGNYIPVPEPKYVPNEDFLRAYGLEYLSQSASLLDVSSGMATELGKTMLSDLQKLEIAFMSGDHAAMEKYGNRLKNAGLSLGPIKGLGWGKFATFSIVKKAAKFIPFIGAAISIGVGVYDVTHGKPIGATTGSVAGEIAGGLAGAAFGAKVGLVGGPIGVAVGVGIGAVAGAVIGSITGGWIGGLFD
ncbi:RHS repeat-associated core domain-containing protein [Stackebrandtia soli]|uniref:RHS repeat-associated core domain-containing protein n=1 Tax=Stackebrandtia soli TaxID=1892856 RepID=UPI0039E865A5